MHYTVNVGCYFFGFVLQLKGSFAIKQLRRFALTIEFMRQRTVEGVGN